MATVHDQLEEVIALMKEIRDLLAMEDVIELKPDSPFGGNVNINVTPPVIGTKPEGGGSVFG